MSNAINEIDNTDLVFIFGYNPADSHPIVANHILRAKQNGARIIVCDPRRIETARIADMHIALRNGSNIALLNAIGHVIIAEQLYDRAFVTARTEGFEAYRKIVERYTPESVEAITGVSAGEIRQAARLYAGAKTATLLWGMGVTQFWQGVETVRSLTSLAMLTGNLGKAHVGVNPVRGQNNVQGACDMGALPDSLPAFLLPDVPLTWETLRILLPVSATLAVVVLLEAIITEQIVEDMTDTPSQRNRECAGQGLANITAGLFGGMGGCAMIGQSVINVSSGGRGRLSCLVAGVLLLLLVVYGADWVRQIPMAALVAVMIMVSIGTFHWRSFAELRLHPKSSTVVMLGTVVVTVATHGLAKGVFTGVLLSALFFARKVGRMLDIAEADTADGTRVYTVSGQVFFASAGQFAAAFDLLHVPERVAIDLSNAHFWDLSAVGALERVTGKLRARGATVEVIGLNAASQTLVERLGRGERSAGIH